MVGDLGFRVLDRDILGHLGFRNYAFKRCDRGIMGVYFDIYGVGFRNYVSIFPPILEAQLEKNMERNGTKCKKGSVGMLALDKLE